MLILWDLNGTALDDMAVWYRAVRRTFTILDVEPPTIEEYFSELESGHFLEVYRRRGITASEDLLNFIYRETYAQYLQDVHFTEEFPAVVQALAAEEHVQGIVSAQLPELVDPVAYRLGLNFLPIAHTAYPVFNKAEKFRELLAATETEPEDAMYVGDAPSDARHAKKAGIIAVTYLNGYLPPRLFSPETTDHFVRSLWEVPKLTESH